MRSNNSRKGRKRSSSGFSTVLMVIMLAVLIVLIMTGAELASGKAARSDGMNACSLAGQSVLSEYNTALFKRYGLFALRLNDSHIKTAAKYYISSSLKGSGGLVRLTPQKIDVETDLFPAMNAKLLETQLVKLGTEAAIYNLFSAETQQESLPQIFSMAELGNLLEEGGADLLEESLKTNTYDAGELEQKAKEERAKAEELRKKIKEESKLSDEEKKASLEEAERLWDSADELEKKSEESRGTADAAEDLLGQLYETVNPQNIFNDGDGTKLTKTQKEDLPTELLGKKATLSLALSGGVLDISKEALLTNEYLLSVCSMAADAREDCVLKCEAEYILYGHDSDAANMTAVKISLFDLRFPLDLLAVYQDPGKMSAINSAALAMAPLPQPACALVLACAEASSMAIEEVRELLSGGNVPITGTAGPGNYRDYLRILLALLPQELKIIRFMDTAQLNLKEKENVPFAFRDFCLGFGLKAELSKDAHFFGGARVDKRTGNFDLQFIYK